MNNFFKNFKLDAPTVLKAAGIGAAVIILVAVLGLFIRIAGSSFREVGLMVNQTARGGIASAPSARPMYDEAVYSTKGEAAYYGGNDAGIDLSTRNVTVGPYPPYGGTATGDTAEEFEVTDYTANIETRRLDETCQTIAGLKARDYVIFENTSVYDRGCGFTFKVKTGNVEEILSVIKTFDPKDFTEDSYTIKPQVDDFTAETEILQKKLASVDETLASSVRAYDELSKLATGARDVESLTKIIDSKLQLIERLTQERININAQLERISRAKAEALDRLDYTYFHVSVFENKYIDGEQLADSWKAAVKEFVRHVNQTIQDVSINLVAMLLLILQYVLYIFILIVVAKYVWRAIRWLWKK